VLTDFSLLQDERTEWKNLHGFFRKKYTVKDADRGIEMPLFFSRPGGDSHRNPLPSRR